MAVPPKAATPEVLRADPNGLRVVWPAVSDAATYSLAWRTSAMDSAPAGAWMSTTGITATRASIPDLLPDRQYDLRVRAVNSDGNGAWSDTLTTSTEEVDDVGILQPDLTVLQMGIETTAGDRAAPTQRLAYTDAIYEPTVERKVLEERGTVLADTVDEVVKRGSMFEITEELSTEMIIGPLLCSLQSVASAAKSGAREWVFTPSVTAPSALGTATIEVGATDGGSDAYRGQAHFCRATSVQIEAGSDTSQATTTWMGRAKQSLASPASGVATPERFIVPSALWECFIDDSWAALGTTKMGRMTGFTLDLDPGISEGDAYVGRSDLDVAYWRRGRVRGDLALVVDHDGDSGAELPHWESGDLRYIRLSASNGGSGAALRSITVDMVVRWIATPNVLAVGDTVHTLDLSGELRADSAHNILRIAVVNGLTTW